MLVNCILVGCGGFIGSVLRYLCSFIKIQGCSLPVATLGVNIVGSFAIMFLTGLLTKQIPTDAPLLLFLRVGLCGGFTTFSTFSVETLGLLSEGKVMLAIGYAALSVILCVAAAFVGEIAASLATSK